MQGEIHFKTSKKKDECYAEGPSREKPLVTQLRRDVNLLTFEISELIIHQFNEKEV